MQHPKKKKKTLTHVRVQGRGNLFHRKDFSSTISAMEKKLINAAADCVAEAIEGVLLSDSRLVKVDGLNILVRNDVHTSKLSTVSVISGKFRPTSNTVHMRETDS
jgi:hypothetical protein